MDYAHAMLLSNAPNSANKKTMVKKKIQELKESSSKALR
jgi:hypothetical protein